MKTIFVVSHDGKIAGAADYLKSYLCRSNHQVLALAHPLDDYKNAHTTLSVNSKELMRQRRQQIGIFNLFIDFFITIYQIRKSTFDTYIGANNFDTYAGIFSRRYLRKSVNKIIYFASDYSENRYKNKLLDILYQKLESYVLRHSDLVISNTKRAEKRRLQLGLQKEKSLVIPNGVYLEKPTFDKKVIRKNHFIYVGSISKEHGLYAFLEAAHPLIERLVVIGSGQDWDDVTALCEDKNIPSEFHYQKDHDFVIDYLQEFEGIGLAPYNHHSKYIYYGSSLKINEYIACGVPVITTHATEMGDFIEEHALGILYTTLDAEVIADSLKHFATNNFSTKAKAFYDSHNYDKLYEKIAI